MDFSEIKELAVQYVKDVYDHRLILNKADKLCSILKKAGEKFVAIDANPTAENITKLIYDSLTFQGLNVYIVLLYETPDSYAAYTGD